MTLPTVSVIPDSAGLTSAQETALSAWLDTTTPGELHHACAGSADEQVVRIALEAGLARLVAHPPWDGASCSRTALEASDAHTLPAPYWPRLEALIAVADVIVVLPVARAETSPLAGVSSRADDAARLAREAGARLVTISALGEVVEEGDWFEEDEDEEE